MAVIIERQYFFKVIDNSILFRKNVAFHFIYYFDRLESFKTEIGVHFASYIVNDIIVEEVFIVHSVELHSIGDRNIRYIYCSLEGVLSEFKVVFLVFEYLQRSFNCLNHIKPRMFRENKSSSLLGIHIVFINGILQTSCFSSNYGSTGNEKFVLNNSTRFKFRRHKSKVASTIEYGSIFKEQIGISPEVVRVFISQIIDFICTHFRVGLFWVGHSSDNDLDFVIGFLKQLFETVQNEVHSLLFGNSSTESEQGNFVVQFIVSEVFFLQFFLGFQVIISSVVDNKFQSFFAVETVREGKRIRFGGQNGPKGRLAH